MMEKENFLRPFKEGWQGLLLAVVIGLAAYFIKVYTESSLVDPLLVAMIIGIALRFILREKKSSGFVIAPMVFIPIGVIFYAMKNLNFVKVSKVNPYIIGLLVIVILTYAGVILLLGRVLKQKKEITYLTATGSAICGASAIAITSPVVDADPDDVSISLLSVTVAAAFGLFMLLPFLAVLFSLDNQTYALFSGSLMQFTGFVKASIGTMPSLTEVIPAEKAMDLALSVKAVRYLGLLIAIPLFASLIKRRFTLPWYLWAFLGAGIAGSIIYAENAVFYKEVLTPAIKPIYNILWAIAMGAIGLNTDIRSLLSNQGLKALIMAFAGFIAAVGIFLLGISVIPL